MVELLSELLFESLEGVGNLGRGINIGGHTTVLCSSGNGKQCVHNIHLSFQFEEVIGSEDGRLRDSELSGPGEELHDIFSGLLRSGGALENDVLRGLLGEAAGILILVLEVVHRVLDLSSQPADEATVPGNCFQFRRGIIVDSSAIDSKQVSCISGRRESSISHYLMEVMRFGLSNPQIWLRP